MSIVTTNDQNYKDIANAIRAKNGTATTYKPAEMSGAIEALATNGAVLVTKEISPTGGELVVLPEGGADGFSSVTVLGDGNLKPENLRKGVTVYGVTGTMESGVNQRIGGGDNSSADLTNVFHITQIAAGALA